jgi:NADPH-dependent 2,4-dienoyl-CoA reductase/sulfur reductase-like enzyme
MKVCVVGAGKAGTEAAREAVLRGAEVTLLDSRERPLPDWGSWPGLIPGNRREAEPPCPAAPTEANLVCGKKVVSVSGGAALTEGGGLTLADAFVISVGSSFEAARFGGWHKPGVTILDSPSKYRGLEVADSERLVVSGEGERGMEVAGRFAGGRHTTLMVASWQGGPPGTGAMSVLEDMSASAGVSLCLGGVERALGRNRLEAVLAEGRVVLADSLVFVPRRLPRSLSALSSPHEGVRVGLDLRSDPPTTLAAGGCAQLTTGIPPNAVLDQEAGVSGRIAGANSTGADFKLPPYRVRTCLAFGLTWTRFGAAPGSARTGGRELATFGERWDERSSCSIVYDKKRGDVLGIETVEGPPRRVSFPPRPPVTLRTLAYDGAWGSSDISMVSETARLGLREWSGS